MISNIAKKYEAYLYVLFRVFVGLLFFMHGAQKLFGWFTDKGAQEWMSLMGAAGAIEGVGGLLILLGLFTRLAALISALEMAVAFFMAHFKPPWVPLQTGGELAMLYFAAFAVVIAYGNGKWSVEQLVFGKETF